MKKRGNEYFAFLNLWPLVGILLCVLFIFMIVTGPPFAHHGLTPDLARVRNAVSHPWANRHDAIRLAVTRDGTLYFGNSRSAAEDIPRQIREWVRDGSERRIYLVVDERALYGDVRVALDCVGEARIEKVTFLVSAPVHARKE